MYTHEITKAKNGTYELDLYKTKFFSRKKLFNTATDIKNMKEAEQLKEMLDYTIKMGVELGSQEVMSKIKRW